MNHLEYIYTIVDLCFKVIWVYALDHIPDKELNRPHFYHNSPLYQPYAIKTQKEQIYLQYCSSNESQFRFWGCVFHVKTLPWENLSLSQETYLFNERCNTLSSLSWVGNDLFYLVLEADERGKLSGWRECQTSRVVC